VALRRSPVDADMLGILHRHTHEALGFQSEVTLVSYEKLPHGKYLSAAAHSANQLYQQRLFTGRWA